MHLLSSLIDSTLQVCYDYGDTIKGTILFIIAGIFIYALYTRTYKKEVIPISYIPTHILSTPFPTVYMHLDAVEKLCHITPDIRNLIGLIRAAKYKIRYAQTIVPQPSLNEYNTVRTLEDTMTDAHIDLGMLIKLNPDNLYYQEFNLICEFLLNEISELKAKTK